jgi:hypothetical protein
VGRDGISVIALSCCRHPHGDQQSEPAGRL